MLGKALATLSTAGITNGIMIDIDCMQDHLFKTDAKVLLKLKSFKFFLRGEL